MKQKTKLTTHMYISVLVTTIFNNYKLNIQYITTEMQALLWGESEQGIISSGCEVPFLHVSATQSIK